MIARRARAGAVRLACALAALVAGTVVGIGGASAHTPHDQIVDVAVSPAFASDRTVFAIVEDRLMRSTDGGDTWTELVRGIGAGASNSTEIVRSLWRLGIAPSDPEVVYVSSRRGDVYRSVDGGWTWTATDFRGAVDRSGFTRPLQNPFLAVSPTDAGVVFAAGPRGGLFRTTDGGSTWTPVGSFGRIASLVFLDGNRLVVADAGHIWLSTDAGATWTAPMATPPGETVNGLAVAGRSPQPTVFAGTSLGRLLRSDDGGRSFSPVSSELAGSRIIGVAASPSYDADRTVWVSTWEKGAYRSRDAGATLEAQHRGLTTNHQADDIKVPQFLNVVAATGGRGQRVLFLAGFDGLFRSADDGARWQAIETQGDYITGLAVSPRYGRDHTVIVNTYVKGAYVTRDGGRTWTVSDRGLEHEVDDGNEFAPVRRLHNVVFSPEYARDGTIFSATWDRFITSTDRGRSWTQVQVAPMPPDGPLRQFVIAISPAFASDHTIFLGTRQGDIYRSRDRGKVDTWETVSNVGALVRSLAVSPRYPSEPVLFAGTAKGVFKSDDAGGHWTRTGPSGIAVLAMSPAYPTDRTLFAATSTGLHVTRDGGSTWSLVEGGPLTAASRIDAVGVSPSYDRDRTVLVSIAGTGLFRSTDGGRTFVEVGRDLLDRSLQIADFSNPTSRPIQFSPAYATDGTIWAYAQQVVVKSTDRGETWEVLTLPSARDYLVRTAARRDVVPTPEPAAARDTASDRGRAGLLVVVGLVIVASGLAVWGYHRRRRAPAVVVDGVERDAADVTARDST